MPQTQPAEEILARGILRAQQSTEIKAGMTAQLIELPYKEGEYFRLGALIAQFDCTLEEAELAALEKRHQTYRLKYENSAELHKFGAAGRLDVALAQSEMQQALAETKLIKARLKYCTIHAPYSGFVTARPASVFETPQQGELLYSLEKSGPLDLSIIVPSNWMTWLKKGHSLEFKIDETGEIIQAQIIRLGASIDPVSQTIEVIAKPHSNKFLMSGMSGYASFERAHE